MARRRRRVIVPVTLFAILVLILGWEGLGLFPSEPGSERGEEAGEEVSAQEEQTGDEQEEMEQRLAARTGTVDEAETDGSSTGGDAANGESGNGSTETAELPEDEDRLRALQELISEAVATGRLGDGFSALQDLEELKEADNWLVVRTAGSQALGDALTGMVLELRAALSRGEVLRAVNELRALRGTSHTRVLQALNTMAAAEGWPSLGEGAIGLQSLRAPLLLDRERQVLVEWEGELVVGAVAECEVDRVTVRLRQPDGVVFPTLQRSRVEPIAATGEEALHQGLVALRAGDRDLAWLWLCRAQVAGGAPTDLARELGRLVSQG